MSKKKELIIQMVKFVLFSASAGIIQILSFTLLNELVNWGPAFEDTEYGPNYFIALVLSVLWNFTFNRKFTFKSANNVPIAMLKVFAYYCVFTPLSIWWGIALTQAVAWEGFEYIVLIGTMLINMATEYLVCKFWVYRNSENTNDIAKKAAKLQEGQTESIVDENEVTKPLSVEESPLNETVENGEVNSTDENDDTNQG